MGRERGTGPGGIGMGFSGISPAWKGFWQKGLLEAQGCDPMAAIFAMQFQGPQASVPIRVMVLFKRFPPAILCCLICGPAAAEAAGSLPPQYVLISFDGAGPLEQWQRSRALAQRTGARFTYFLSCVYLVAREDRARYRPPHDAPGRSNVGFAASRGEAVARLGEIWAARAEGHEIASHGCGHFDGGAWSAAQWKAEFDQFSTLLAEGWTLNGAAEREPGGWRDFSRDEIVGFRAPYLSTGPGLFSALAERGFSYDASTVSRGPAMPHGDRPVRFSLPMIAEGPRGRPVIAMDYNLFVRHSGGIERENPDAAFEERTLAAFHAALDAERAGRRTPLHIGLHFTLMNGGAYWRALERFAEEACTRPDIRCVSYRDWLEETAADG